VSTATFASSRKGFDPAEVRDFLRMVAAELARLQDREKTLEREVRTAQRGTTNPAVALDEEVVTRLLGEEAARILTTAREAASQIKVRAEESASRVLREATDEAQRMREEAEIEAARRRQDASSDAEAELQMAKQQGRDMVNEARAYRERVLGELARRREMARQQIEQLVHGRDRLLQAFERARLAAVDVMAEMTPLGQPSEYVNLSPTTGPVPLMVPVTEMPPFDQALVDDPEHDDPAVDDPEHDDPEHDDSEHDDPEHDDPAVDELVADVEDDTEPVEHTDPVEPDLPDEHLAPVVSLFAGEVDAVVDVTGGDVTGDGVTGDGVTDDDVKGDGAPKASVDDLFAKLRASRTETVAARAGSDDTVTLSLVPDAGPSAASPEPETPAVDATEELSVFSPSPEAPLVATEFDDSPFGRRDAELTPLIVTSARKLKRVLADEQNDVLHALRGQKKVTFAAMLPSEADHVRRYADSIDTELRAAAMAGAGSLDSRSDATHLRAVNKASAVQPAIDAVGSAIVLPLRERLERAVIDTDGDPDELVSAARAIYREWKVQRIDEHLDDVALAAFGHGQLAALKPGTPVCWGVDPHGPACPDAEDNALGGVVAAGDPFPTEHTCAPAHPGCRCMLLPAPR
jgi:DivIVA domain-containing protein